MVFCHPLRFFPGTAILLSTCLSALLPTCPYHFSLFSVIFLLLVALLIIFSHVHCLSSRLHTSIAASSSHSPQVSIFGLLLLSMIAPYTDAGLCSVLTHTCMHAHMHTQTHTHTHTVLLREMSLIIQAQYIIILSSLCTVTS